MNNEEIFTQAKEYNPDKDIEETGGNYGIYLANLISRRSLDCSDFGRGELMEHLSNLEIESLHNEALLRQNN